MGYLNYLIGGLLVISLIFYPSLDDVPINEDQVLLMVTEEGGLLTYSNSKKVRYIAEQFLVSEQIFGKRLTIDDISVSEAKIVIPEYLKLIGENVVCNNPYPFKKKILFEERSFLICPSTINNGSIQIEYIALY